MARSKTDTTTCSDCYFRVEGLCALAGETVCPTFRQATRGRLTPPRQAQLVPLTRPAEAAPAAAAPAPARRPAFA